MYTKEHNENGGEWEIIDPEGDWICDVASESEANDLLSHLNR